MSDIKVGDTIVISRVDCCCAGNAAGLTGVVSDVQGDNWIVVKHDDTNTIHGKECFDES